MTVGYDPAVATLLTHGAQLDAVDDDGRGPLHHPRLSGPIVARLVAAGARLDARDRFGMKPSERASALLAQIEAAEEAGVPTSPDDDDCLESWVRAITAAE